MNSAVLSSPGDSIQGARKDEVSIEKDKLDEERPTTLDSGEEVKRKMLDVENPETKAMADERARAEESAREEERKREEESARAEERAREEERARAEESARAEERLQEEKRQKEKREEEERIERELEEARKARWAMREALLETHTASLTLLLFSVSADLVLTEAYRVRRALLGARGKAR